MMRKYCATCYRPIIPGSNQLTTSLMGDDYHISCLNCAKCSLPLWGKPFVKKKDGKLYCEEQCESIRSKHMSKTNQSQIFYNNQVDPNDKLYMLNQITSPPLVMPLTSPRFNMMNNLMYQNPYFNPNVSQPAQYQPNFNDYMKYNSSISNGNIFDLQTELNKAIDKIDLKQTNKLNEINTNNEEKINYETNKNTTINSDNLNFTNNLASLSDSSISSSASSTSNKCYKCNGVITNNKDKYTFEDRFYHKDCYRCDICRNELFKMKKVLKGPNNSGTYCEPCYFNLYGPKCGRCNHVVMPYMLSDKYNDKMYHRECFICQWCKKNLAYEQFIDTGKIFICKKCY